MNFDHIKSFIGSFTARDLPEGGAGLAGIIMFFFIFRAKKAFVRILLLLLAVGLFAGAYWWHQNK